MAEPPAPPVPADGAVLDVVVVDDQAPFRSAARALVEQAERLRFAGEAADGDAGVALVAAVRPAVAIVDVHMPGVDGVDAARLIGDRSPRTVVVLVSSYDRDDLPDRVAASGAAYLHKAELTGEAIVALWRDRAPGA